MMRDQDDDLSEFDVSEAEFAERLAQAEPVELSRLNDGATEVVDLDRLDLGGG